MKSTMRLSLCASLAAACVFAAGCIGTPVRLPAPATMDSYDPTSGRAISADAAGFQLLLLIPIGTNSIHKRAYDSLVQQAGNDYLTNVQVQESWFYAFVGTIYGVRMKAMAYRRIGT